MNRSVTKPQTTSPASGAVIISLAAERACRSMGPDTDLRRAATTLARFRSGDAPFTELMAALVAPFNRDAAAPR